MAIIFIVLGLIAVAATFFFVARHRFEKEVENDVTKIIERARENPLRVYHYRENWAVPPPVRRYLHYAIKDSQEIINFVRLKHHGYFRLRPKQAWLEIEGEQYYDTQQPAFVWCATVHMNSLLRLRAKDKLWDGQGNVLVKLFSAISIANAKGAKVDISSLLRFVADMPWFPTAMIPSQHLAWQPIDDNSATAVFTYDGLKASVVFHFDETGRIVKMTTKDRYKENTREDWTTYYRDYQCIHDLMIPTEGEAVWNLQSGDFSYAKFLLDEIEYDHMELKIDVSAIDHSSESLTE